MIKNRTLIAIVCIVLAVLLCFCIAPIVTNLFNGTQRVVILTSDTAPGVQISKSMLSTVQVSKADAFSFSYVDDPEEIVGKYSKTFLYSGIVTADMFGESAADSNTKLLSLEAGEFAMSVTIQSFAGGFSNKIRSGDIVSIVSVDDKDEAHIINELRYVEVIALTTDEGVDVTEQSAEEIADTATFKLIDESQLSQLLSCEEGTLHIAFVTRDEKLSEEYLKIQKEYFKEADEEADESDISENNLNGGDDNAA